MSLHKKPKLDFPYPGYMQFAVHPNLGKPKPAVRVIRQVWGMPVSAAHTRRPRVLRLEVSNPRDGAKEIRL